MNRRTLLAAVLAAGLTAGCGGSELLPGDAAPATGAPPTTSAPTTQVSATTPATTTPSEPVDELSGNNYGDLLAVDTAARTVTVDVVEYFTGAAAVRACQQDGRGVSGAWCSTYYVRNKNPRQRRIELAPRATITVVTYDSKGVHVATPATLTQVEDLLDERNFYRLRVDDGRITELEGVYLP